MLVNDWYACLQVLSKQLYVWNAYLSLLGYNLVKLGFNYHEVLFFPLICPRTGIEMTYSTPAYSYLVGLYNVLQLYGHAF